MYNNDYNNNQQNNGYQTLHQIDFQEFLRKQNGEQRIHMLEMEIAKTTDELVRARLEKMLRQEIARQKQQRRRYIIASVLIVIFIIIAAIIGFAYVKNMNNTVAGAEPDNPQTQQEILTTNSTNDATQQDAATSNAVNSDSTAEIDSFTLTDQQIKDWTHYHFILDNPNLPKEQTQYNLEIYDIDKTNESFIDVSTKFDSTGLYAKYRINNLGYLVKLDVENNTGAVVAKTYDVPNTYSREAATKNSNEIDTTNLSADEVNRWVFYHFVQEFAYTSEDVTFNNTVDDFYINSTLLDDQNLEVTVSYTKDSAAIATYLIDQQGYLYKNNADNSGKTLITTYYDVP